MSLTQSLRLVVEGNKATPSVVRLKPTSQRTTQYAAVGWTWRRRYRVTNGSGEVLRRYPYALDLGDTTGLVGGSKALASGDDLRVTVGGLEVARTLVDWNDGAHDALAWLVLPDLRPGEAVVLEVLYGNPQAGSPPVLAYPDLPAFDVTTAGAGRSDNGTWVYDVARVAANAARGAWWVERGDAAPGRHDVSIPGAWAPAMTLDNGLDDTLQPRWSSYDDTLTYWMGRFDATRARDGSLVGVEVAVADGVVLANPLGITGVTCDFVWLNQVIGAEGSDPVGQLVVAGRNAEGDDWQPFYANAGEAATEATIAAATYAPPASMKQVCCAVWPNNGVAIPANATTGRYAHAAWGSQLSVAIDDSLLTVELIQEEEEIYEVAAQLAIFRDGTGDGAVDNRVAVGNHAQVSGAGTPRTTVRLGEWVVIDGQARTAAAWDTALAARVEDLDAGEVTAVDVALDRDGAEVENPARTWLELRPARNPLANPSFDEDASGWSRSSATAGVTAAAIARDTSVYASSPASGAVVISANAAGAGATVLDVSEAIPLNGARRIAVAADVRTSNANLRPLLAVYFYDAADAFISGSVEPAWTPAADAWYRRNRAADAPANAAQYRVGLLVSCASAGPTGTVRFDTITVNDNELRFDQPAGGGSVTVEAEWTERWA